jgi:hypothetical protein
LLPLPLRLLSVRQVSLSALERLNGSIRIEFGL